MTTIRFAMLAAAIAALALPTTAGASAQLLAPGPGATVTSHPTFTWSHPEGELSEAIDIATSPATIDDGNFDGDSIVQDALFGDDDELSWAPEQGLFAGSYWWMVETFDPDFNILYAVPQPFTVVPAGRIDGLRLQPDGRRHRLQVAVLWGANVPAPVLVEKVSHAGRVIWTRRATGNVTSVDQTTATKATWQRPPRMPRGTRLSFSVTVEAGSGRATASRTFRAP